MPRESLPLAPEISVDQHARFEQPEDSPLYAYVMELLAELRARYFVLSHTGCSRPTGCREVAERLVTLRANPELQFEVDRLAKKAIQVTWVA